MGARLREVVDEHQEDEAEVVADAFAWDVDAEPSDAAAWSGPRCDVPTLGLRGASVGEVVLAAQRTLDGSTPDVLYSDAAVAARDGDEGTEEAEALWRACLASGDMKAHYGLGYTLVVLGRPHEGFGRLRAYTEICPRNP